MSTDNKDPNHIPTAKELWKEFNEVKDNCSSTPLDVLMGTAGAKAELLMNSLNMYSLVVIANELGRIADALERMSPPEQAGPLEPPQEKQT